MSNLIARMYGNEDDAAAAVKDLLANGFGDDRLVIVGPPAPGQNSTDPIVAALLKGNILQGHATIYADGILKGGSFVGVHAVFGAGVKATMILDRHNPIEFGVSEATDPGMVFDPAAPVSSTFGWPLLWSNATPLSMLLGYGALLKAGTSLSKFFGIPLLSNSATPLSTQFNLPTLSSDPSPLSTFFKIPVLR